jgi:hypothetical protein
MTYRTNTVSIVASTGFAFAAALILAGIAPAQVKDIGTGGFHEGHSDRIPEWASALVEHMRNLCDQGKPLDALRELDAAERQYGAERVGRNLFGFSRAHCYVMLGDFAAAKRAMEPAILPENWDTLGHPRGIGAYVLASLGEQYQAFGSEGLIGPRHWDECGRKNYVDAAWPEPTTPELVRFYAGLFVVDANNMGVNDAIAKQLEGIWRDHPMLIERRARRYEERRLWQHAINEAQDLRVWVETPDQVDRLDSWIREMGRSRDRQGGG